MVRRKDILQTEETGTFPPARNDLMICPLLSPDPVESRDGEVEAA